MRRSTAAASDPLHTGCDCRLLVAKFGNFSNLGFNPSGLSGYGKRDRAWYSQATGRNESDGCYACNGDAAQRRRICRCRRCQALHRGQVRMLPNVAASKVTFPESYKEPFSKYHTINFSATKQVRYFYANMAAVTAAKAGQPLPDGSVLFVEVYTPKLDADNRPMTGADGLIRCWKLSCDLVVSSESVACRRGLCPRRIH
jgi:hypothetical protein